MARVCGGAAGTPPPPLCFVTLASVLEPCPLQDRGCSRVIWAQRHRRGRNSAEAGSDRLVAGAGVVEGPGARGVALSPQMP